MPTIDKTDQDIYADLRSLLKTMFSCEVLQGYPQNSPPPLGDFVYMNILNKRNLPIQPINEYAPENGLAFVREYKQVLFQLDFYGENSESHSSVFENLWGNFYACEKLKTCQPLQIISSTHSPIINETNNYEQRQVVTATLQYNPVVTHDQEFADKSEVNFIYVEGKP